jgi:formylglycine-generating enzyme required for sulfatase activity
MTLRELLTRHGLSAYADVFERERIALPDLSELSDDDLRGALGMAPYLDRKRFRAMVASLPGDASAPSGSSAALASGATRTGPPPADPGATRMDASSSWPAQIGNYRILGVVGAGGMGTVLRARHTVEAWAEKQGGDVAIKLIHPHLASDPAFQRRFIDEAGLGRSVSHAGLVPVYDVVSDGAWLGSVMGLVSGEPLSSRVTAGGLPVAEVIRLLAPVGEALDFLHGQGIVHRDVKPANIMVRGDGRPMLLDLGIAKDTRGGGESHTRTMTAMGTSAWMAPEQADAKHVDGAADRYAFGLMVYALLSGRMPWEADTSELGVVVKKAKGQLEALGAVRSGLPGHVSGAVMRMVSVAASERYPTCAAFVEALRETGPRRVRYNLGVDVSFEMVVIPPCRFTMGSPPSEPNRRDDEPQHEVRLTRAYAMATTPVTQALYQAVMGANPSWFKDGAEAPQRPVEQVRSWYDAVRFCNALSVKVGLRPAYTIGGGDAPEVTPLLSADGFRLPTEAEWECAARAGTAHAYAGGDDLDALGWYDENSGDTTHAVGQKRANVWGLHDMSGHVWEWVSDWHGAYPNGSVTDPQGAPSGSDRVFRGGGWYNSARNARVAFRGGYGPGSRLDFVGFRLARTVP